MQAYEPSKIRSFALVGHGGCGKTSIAEAMSLIGGHAQKLGKAADPSSLLDFEAEEHKRGGSMKSSFLTVEYDGYKVHVVDTPGDGNFLHEARVVLQGVDGVVVVVSAHDGVEVSTEQMSSAADAAGRPRAVFINKMDRENSDYKAVVEDLEHALGMKPVMLQLPIGSEHSFSGVIDLLYIKAYTYDGHTGIGVEGPMPAGMDAAIAVAREAMAEAVAETDDALLEHYLEHGELTQEELRAGLNKAITAGKIVPVLLGSATKNIGVDKILWAARALPSPTERGPFAGASPDDPTRSEARSPDPSGPAAALVLKTTIDPFAGQVSVLRVVSGTLAHDASVLNVRTGQLERLGTLFHLIGKKHVPVDRVVAGDLVGIAKLKDTITGDTLCDPKHRVKLAWEPAPEPMISFTLKPKSQKDVDKLKGALNRLLVEDVGLHQSHDEVSKELVLSGMGQNHVALSIEKMARKFGVAVDLATPHIPYRETITGQADVRYRHKKQTGGAGQFGEVAIRMAPAARGSGVEFLDEIAGGVISHALIPAVEKGVRDRLQMGALCGFPVVDVTVALYDGKMHAVDSKDIAFQMAGRQAAKKAVLEARPVLLEPVQQVDVLVPDAMVGDVMGDLNSRRGRILTMDSRGRNAVVKALVPLAELLTYAQELRSMTGGKGSFSMKHNSYEQVPGHMQEKLVQELHRLQEEEE